MTKKRDIDANRLLRARPTFSKMVMVSVAVSKLGCTHLIFVEPGAKVDAAYYRDVVLRQQMLPGIRQLTYTFFSKVTHLLIVLVTQSSYCAERHHHLFGLTCGQLTALTSTLSITAPGDVYSSVYIEASERC